MIDALPPPRFNKWAVFAVFALILFGVVYFTPLSQLQREIVVNFANGVLKQDLKVTVQAATDPLLLSAGREVLQTLALPVLVASLCVISLIWIYGLQRWILNNPDLTLNADCTVERLLRDAHKNEGVWAEEKGTFTQLRIKEPWELPLDVLVYVLYLFPLLLALGLIFGGLFLPTGSRALSEVLATFTTKDRQTLELIVLGSALMLAAFLALAHGLNRWYLRITDVRAHQHGSIQVLPGTAIALNLLVVGLGQVYIGKTRRGIFFFFSWFLFYVGLVMFNARSYLNSTIFTFSVYSLVFILATVAIYVYSAYDVWRLADKRNLGEKPFQQHEGSGPAAGAVDRLLSITRALDYPRQRQGTTYLLGLTLLAAVLVFAQLGPLWPTWQANDPYVQVYVDDFYHGNATWAIPAGTAIVSMSDHWLNDKHVQIHYMTMNKLEGRGYAEDFSIERFKSVNDAHAEAIKITNSEQWHVEQNPNLGAGGAYQKKVGYPALLVSWITYDNSTNTLNRVYQVQDMVMKEQQTSVAQPPELLI